MFFPWQTQQWQQLWRSKQESRLSHALLFSGLAGTGKTIFAESFARTLLCQQVILHEKGTVNYCDVCHACRMMAGRVHPNVLYLEPEKTGQAIKVDQVRAVSDFVNQSSLQGEYRIVIVHPADDMNTNAANALLKTLEEPPKGAIIILISNQLSRLPATIVSRCQRILFPRPQAELALDWLIKQLPEKTQNPHLLLQLAHGAPLAALGLLENETLTLRENLFTTLYALSQKQADPLQSAAKLQVHDPLQLLDFTLSWLQDLLRLQLTADITNQDYANQLATLKINGKQTIKLFEYVLQLRKQISSGLNLNKQLLLESVFIRWLECA